MTYKYRAHSISERMRGIPGPALLDLLRHHAATSSLARPCPAGPLLVLRSRSPAPLPDQAFLEGRYLELAPRVRGWHFGLLSCDKVPRQELRWCGVIRLLCCDIKCSKPLNGQNCIFFFFLVLRNLHAHLLCHNNRKT